MIINSFLVKNESTVLTSCASGYHLVRFFDYDGTLLKTECVEDGEAATAPEEPSHASLDITFDEWNQALTNITEDRDIGAIYAPDNGKTHIHLRITVETGKNASLFINKSDTSSVIVNWGDSTSNSNSSASGDVDFNHTYADYGDYIVTIWVNSGSGYFYLGQGSYDSGMGWIYPSFVGGSTSDRKQMLKKIFIGSDVRLNDSAFYECRGLEVITLPSDLTLTIDEYAFHDAQSLKALIIPSGFLSIPAYFCQDAHALRVVSVPQSLTTFNDYCFDDCYALEKIVFPAGLTTIENYAFRNCKSLRFIETHGDVTNIKSYAFAYLEAVATYVFAETTPPTLSASTVFYDPNAGMKIYVPDANEATYKAATNWSTYADYIYPISEKGVTHND